MRFGPHHGVFAAAPADSASSLIPRHVRAFWQKSSIEQLTTNGAVQPDGTVWLDSGVVWFAPSAVHAIVSLARAGGPLAACTYFGVDGGLPALRVELYSDMLLALNDGMGTLASAYETMPSGEPGPSLSC